jgi:hypothetical protein|uniref:Uncharacterized protein n=1 Tax=viral metagenome TaxID=1070528 RepID=A0A6C0BRI8_9ZZZZ
MNTDINNSYNDVIDIIDNKTDDRSYNRDYDLQTEEIYQKLMKKEEKVLDVLNDIHKHKYETTLQFFMNTPIHIILRKIIATGENIYTELYDSHDILDFVKVITKKERLIYTGVIFVLIGLVLTIISL